MCLRVEFLFEERERPATEQSEKPSLTRKHMVGLPNKLVDEMRAAVQGGYMERLAELAKDVAEFKPELSEQLMKIVDGYDYKTLSHLFLDDGEDK